MIKFNTKKEANDYVKELDNAVYYLRHGEAGRPSYKVRKVRNQPFYGIWVEYNFYIGTFNAPKMDSFVKNNFMTSEFKFASLYIWEE